MSLKVVNKSYETEFKKIAEKYCPQHSRDLVREIMAVIRKFQEANELS